MLLKKGASIKNIIIILSSWAVIKVPMLTIEAKFLGLKFMIVRYILTIMAIIIFSSIASLIAKKGSIPIWENTPKAGLQLNKDICMGCTICTKKYPELFYIKGKKAHINKTLQYIQIAILEATIISCPVKAIEYNNDEEKFLN